MQTAKSPLVGRPRRRMHATGGSTHHEAQNIPHHGDWAEWKKTLCLHPTTHRTDGPSKPFCHSTNQTGNNEAHIPLTAVTTIATITAITAVTAITVKHRPKAPPFADSHGQRLPAASAPHASNHLPHPTGTAQLVTRAGRRNRCGSSCLLQPRAATHAPEVSPPAGAAFER